MGLLLSKLIALTKFQDMEHFAGLMEKSKRTLQPDF
jgi:hypothetical protein